MEKKKRVLYEVSWSDIDICNEDGTPSILSEISPVEIDGIEYSGDFYTANILEAADRFEFISNVIDGTDGPANQDVCLSKIEFYLGEEDWDKLLNKSELDFSDIQKLKTTSTVVIADAYRTETDECYNDDYYGEILKVSSQYFNMKAVCEKAGINYSTYKGFKNNNQYFSSTKILILLECMHDIGISCLNDRMRCLLKNIRSEDNKAFRLKVEKLMKKSDTNQEE